MTSSLPWMMTGGQMTKYKVIGDRLINYYVFVEAEDDEEAWQIATNNDLDWIELDSSLTIEPHTVELEEELNVLEDGYPSMENEILVMDKTDKQDSVDGGSIGLVTGVFTNSRKSYIINTDHRKDQYNGNKA